MSKTNLPKAGSLVVVSHWLDFDYPYDAVKLGIFKEYKDGYWYIEFDSRGYRYCREVNVEVIEGRKIMFKKLIGHTLRSPSKIYRQDFKFVSYKEAEDLLTKGYILAPEEDDNHVFGMVYLELLGDKPKDI